VNCGMSVSWFLIAPEFVSSRMPMFRDSWTDEDQRVVERLAKKFSVDLEDPRVTGENASARV